MADDISLSPVKREKLKKEANIKKKIEMRAALPILTAKDIRRYRAPYHEALLAELDEEGFMHSARFILELIENQKYYIQPYKVITTVQSRLSNPDYDWLFEYLRKAEKAHREKKFTKELDALFTLTVHYAFGSSDYWWLGEQLLLKCLKVSSGLDDRGRGDAFSAYIYGKFLLENVKNAELAKEYLTKARQLSSDRHWNASKILQSEQETIFVESCILLHKAYLAEAIETLSKNPENALNLCNLAKARATEACYFEGEYKALLLKGKCELLIGDTTAGTVTFSKILMKQIRRGSVPGICEAKLQLAQAFVKHGNSNAALKHLTELTTYAQEQKLFSYVGQAYKAMGQYYLSIGKPQEATPLLITAFQIFHEENDITSREEARTLAAISAGEELLPEYTELIWKCGKAKNSRHFVLKLIRWKDSRDVFWSESNAHLESATLLSYENIIKASIENLVQLSWPSSKAEFRELELKNFSLDADVSSTETVKNLSVGSLEMKEEGSKNQLMEIEPAADEPMQDDN